MMKPKPEANQTPTRTKPLTPTLLLLTAQSPITQTPRLILASQSPGRRELLTRAGITFTVELPQLEDDDFRRGSVDAKGWAAALAFGKASAVVRRLRKATADHRQVWVLGADTIVVHNDQLIGKAPTPEAARDLINRFANDTHEVVTGAALINVHTSERILIVDAATVHVGPITPPMLDAFIATNNWRGKAGAYNLDERVAAGWPIRWEGDPATVTGLPMRALRPHLTAFQATQPG